MKPDGIAEILASFEDEGDPARRYRDGDAVAVCGMISSFSVKTSKAGNRFCLLRLEDAHGSMDALIFEKVLDRISDYLENGRPVYLKGKLSAKEEEGAEDTVSDLMPLLPDSQFEHLSKSWSPRARSRPLKRLRNREKRERTALCLRTKELRAGQKYRRKLRAVDCPQAEEAVYPAFGR